jgi:hypothetical protein
MNQLEHGLRRRLLARRGQPRYLLLDACNGCGKCCEAPAIQLERLTWSSRALRGLVVWWQRRVNGMELRSSDARFRLLTFHCTHYEPSTRRCDSYDSRPFFCRDYPRNLTFDPVPQLFDECSHRVVDRHAEALTAALESAGLRGEKLEEVRKKLYLR